MLSSELSDGLSGTGDHTVRTCVRGLKAMSRRTKLEGNVDGRGQGRGHVCGAELRVTRGCCREGLEHVAEQRGVVQRCRSGAQ